MVTAAKRLRVRNWPRCGEGSSFAEARNSVHTGSDRRKEVSEDWGDVGTVIKAARGADVVLDAGKGLKSGDKGFNPRHHGEHYHVETKPNGMSWSKAAKSGEIVKAKPEEYTPGSGTGFIPGEKFPGAN